MKCKNCGEKVFFLSNYCESCGSEVESVWSITKSNALKFLSFIKKRKLATCIVLGVLVAIIAFSTVWDVTHRLDPTDYITVSVGGFEGKGEIEPAIDYTALCEKLLGKEPDATTKKGYEKTKEYNKNRALIAECFSIAADRAYGLSNGDMFIVTVKVLDKAIIEDLGYNLVHDEYYITMQVGKDCDSLGEPTELDLLQYINASFSGTNGYGEYEIVCSAEPIEINHPTAGKINLTLEYYESFFQDGIYVKISDTTERIYVDLTVEAEDSLSNGDKIKISIDEDSIEDMRELGFVIETTRKTVIVSGLE